MKKKLMLSLAAIIKPVARKTIAIKKAVNIDNLPEAIALYFFLGCFLSACTSSTSFNKYPADAVILSNAKAYMLNSSKLVSLIV